MSGNGREIPWVDGALYNRNRNKFPREIELQHAGKHVAFNFEGTQILASGVDREDLEAALVRLGIPRDRVVFERIPELWEEVWF